MPATRFPIVRLVAGLLVVIVGLSVVAMATMDEADLSVATVDDSSTTSIPRSAGSDPATRPSGDPGDAESSDPADPTPDAGPANPPTPPALPPLEPPDQPEAGPLVVLTADPAAAGITDFQSLGVPAPGDHGGPGSFSVGTGCASPCIDSGVATPLGTGAHIEVATDTPARIWIVVWNETLNHHFMVDSGPGSEVTAFGSDFVELTAGTVYQAMAVAQDANGYTDHAYGEFETLRRHVRFGISDIAITSQPSQTERFGTSKWADGVLYEGGVDAPFPTIENVDDSVELIVQLSAHWPCDGLCQAVGSNGAPPDANSGSSPSSAWIVLTLWDPDGDSRRPIDLEGTPALVESPTARTFVATLSQGPDGPSLPADYGAPLGARIEVTVWVTYS